MIKTQSRSLRFDHAAETSEQSLQARTERQIGPTSRIVGLYQTMLRKTLEHFFPNAILEVQGDRSVIDWDGSPDETHYRFDGDLDGVGLDIHWLGTHLSFRPESPIPLLPLERRLVEVVVQALDRRFRGLFDHDFADRLERFQYLTEDLIITDFLQPVSPYRVPAALEALRVAALSTYENRRLSTALLLGSDRDPAVPDRTNTQGAPRFNARLTAIKGFHRLCDGVQTLFIVDAQGNLFRLADIQHWADTVQGAAVPENPCPRQYHSHANATRQGGHVCLILTPSQDIKVFAGGTMMFSLSDARWRCSTSPASLPPGARRWGVPRRRIWLSGCSRRR